MGINNKELEVGRDKDLVTLDLNLISASFSFDDSNSRFARDSKLFEVSTLASSISDSFSL